MRAALLALVLALVAPACGEPRPAAQASDASHAGAIASVLDDWHDAAAHADEARYFGHFAEGAVFLGTDGTERWTLPEFRAYAHPHFARGKAWAFRATRREVTFSGDTAWFDEDLDTPHLGPARGTGVLVRDASGQWKIAQYNLSVPIPNERFEEVRAIIARGARAD
jgi:ketosteroid isomerase-like protein